MSLISSDSNHFVLSSVPYRGGDSIVLVSLHIELETVDLDRDECGISAVNGKTTMN